MSKKDKDGIKLFFDDEGDCTADYVEVDYDNCWGIKCNFLEIQNLEIPKSDEIEHRYYCTAVERPIIDILKDRGICPKELWWSKIEGKVLTVIKGVKNANQTKRKKPD